MRGIVRIGLAVLLTVGAAAIGAAQQPPVLHVATLVSDSGAEVFYAQDMGFFTRAGLNVEITVMRPALIPPAVESKSIDIAEINVASLAAAREHGQQFGLIAPSAVYSIKLPPTAGIIVAKDSPIRTARDFNGKIVAVNGLQNIGQVTTQQWIDKNGGDSSTVKFVEMTNDAMINAIELGRVDAGEINEPSMDDAFRRGQRSVGPGYDAVANEFLIGGYFCSLEFVRTHPDLARRFAAVIAETARWANTHQAESGKILEKWTKLPVSPSMPRVHYGERLVPAVVQPIVDVSYRYHLLRSPISAVDLIVPGFMSR